MSSEIDEKRLAAWRNFITAHATLIDLIDGELRAADRIQLNCYDVLIELAEAPEKGLRMHELAHNVVLSRSGLTRMVDKLEADGLLRRQPDPNDRRGSNVVLTEKGREVLRQAWPIYAKGIAEYFGKYLSEAEAQTLTDIFTRILDAARTK